MKFPLFKTKTKIISADVRLGIPGKFIALVTTLLLVALGGWGSVLALKTTRQIEAELQGRAQEIAKFAARLCAEVLLAGSLSGIDKLMKEVQREPGVAKITILDSTGKLLWEGGEGDPQSHFAASATISSVWGDNFGIAVVQLYGEPVIQAQREVWLSVLQLGLALWILLSAAIWFAFSRMVMENLRLYEETKQRASELQVMTRELEAKNRELDTFVYTVSHDLKAPLVSLKGMADLLLQDYGGKLDQEGRHYLERLKGNTEQMERLILDLLALSRIGREGRAAEAVDLDEVVATLLTEWAEPIRSKEIKVVRSALPILWGIRPQIEQVMANLFSNAVKYIGNSPHPLIQIGTTNGAEGMVQCYVRDNGIGIDPLYHEKIFGLFHRLKETEAEGTGVGLAIVKKIVEGTGGKIWVESQKGQGTTFYFTWPKVQGS